MKGFKRTDQIFSLCGLNCGLCPMHLDGYCPGCGGGPGNQPCAIARCSLTHGGLEYCFQCEEFPCEKYRGIDAFDSFITHKNQMRDMQRAQEIGLDAYHKEQAEKLEALKALLDGYNDGRRKALFCAAINLLGLDDIRRVLALLETDEAAGAPIKEKAAHAAELLQEAAARASIELKLRKKSAKEKKREG